MKKLKVILIVSLVLIAMACQKEDSFESIESNEISAGILQKLQSLYFNTNDVSNTYQELPDGSKIGGYLVEDDIFIPYDQLDELEVPEECDEKQYRTYNSVYSPRVIEIIGYTAYNEYSLTQKMITALDRAVWNYNVLDMGISFYLSYGSDYSERDIVVYQVPGVPGGSSGFPSYGDPYKWVQINSETEGYSYNVIEHIITHEIGHCIGLRHTDWFSFESCGTYGWEAEFPWGLMHIPGTPESFDSTSLMNKCFEVDSDGEFGPYDIVALEYMY